MRTATCMLRESVLWSPIPSTLSYYIHEDSTFSRLVLCLFVFKKYALEIKT